VPTRTMSAPAARTRSRARVSFARRVAAPVPVFGSLVAGLDGLALGLGPALG